MPVLNKFETITVADGVNYDINLNAQTQEYLITGTDTLTGTWSVTAGGGGSAASGMICVFRYEATVTLGGNNLVILGTTLPSSLATKECDIVARYNGSSWIVKFFPDFEESGFVTSSNILDDEIINADINSSAAIELSKLEDLTRGSIISGQTASDTPTALALGGTGQMLTSDGTDISWTTVAGDVSMTSGTFTIANDAVENTMINTNVVGDGLTGGSGSSIDIEPDTTNGTSMAVTSDGLRLDGDETSPANIYYYGTNSGGSKGWHDLSALIASSNDLQNAYDNGNTIAITSGREVEITNSTTTTAMLLTLSGTTTQGLRILRGITGSGGDNFWSGYNSAGVASGIETINKFSVIEDATDGGGSKVTYYDLLCNHVISPGSLADVYMDYNLLTSYPGQITTASTYTHYYAIDSSTSNINLNNASAEIYGFRYYGGGLHTNGNRYGVYVDMDTAVTAGQGIGFYMDMGATSSNKWGFSFQGSEKGHTGSLNGGYDSNNLGTFTASGYIKIKVGSDTRYIPYGEIT